MAQPMLFAAHTTARTSGDQDDDCLFSRSHTISSLSPTPLLPLALSLSDSLSLPRSHSITLSLPQLIGAPNKLTTYLVFLRKETRATRPYPPIGPRADKNIANA